MPHRCINYYNLEDGQQSGKRQLNDGCFKSVCNYKCRLERHRRMQIIKYLLFKNEGSKGLEIKSCQFALARGILIQLVEILL